MVRIEWFADDPGYLGGAEYTSVELYKHAPAEVEFVRESPDLVVLQNCVQLPADQTYDVPFVKVVHDVWPEGEEEFRKYVLENAAMLFFSSPAHVEQFPHKFKAPYQIIPPAMNLRPFREAEPIRDRDVLWLANNLTTLKGHNRAQRWAFDHSTHVDYYGEFTIGGPVEFFRLPGLMRHYRRFLYLPNELEPFGRTVAEAWAAGLELIVDESKVGAMWWIKERPEDMEKGVEMFWHTILDKLTVDSHPRA